MSGAVDGSIFQEPKLIGAVSGGEFCPPMRTTPYRLYINIYIYIYLFIYLCFNGIERALKKKMMEETKWETERNRDAPLNMKEEEEHVK